MHHIFVIPIEGEDIVKQLENTHDPNLFNTYQNKGVISVSDLVKAIRCSKTPDEDFLRWFVPYAIATVLAPTTQHYVDAKYLNLVKDIANIRKLN